MSLISLRLKLRCSLSRATISSMALRMSAVDRAVVEQHLAAHGVGNDEAHRYLIVGVDALPRLLGIDAGVAAEEKLGSELDAVEPVGIERDAGVQVGGVKYRQPNGHARHSVAFIVFVSISHLYCFNIKI